MFGSEILEVAVGLIFIYLLLSMICAAIREGIESWMKTRAAHLERGIREMLHDRDGAELSAALYNHPLVHSLFLGDYPTGARMRSLRFRPSQKHLPSYIPASNFAIALLDIVARGPSWQDVPSEVSEEPLLTTTHLRAAVRNVHNVPVQRALLTALDTARGDVAVAQANVEAWYNSTMDRVSGWYRRQTQFILFGLGLLVTLMANVNTIAIAEYLYSNDAARSVIVAQAERPPSGSPGADSVTVGQLYGRLAALRLPIGWDSIATPQGAVAAADDDVPWWRSLGAWLWPARFVEAFRSNPWSSAWYPVLGWLLTAVAISFGAPFWFDLLNKVMVIRSTVKPHEKSPEESSEDRVGSAPRPPPHLGGPPPDAAAPAPALPTARSAAEAAREGGGTAVAAEAPPGPPPEELSEPFTPHEWANDHDPEEGVL